MTNPLKHTPIHHVVPTDKPPENRPIKPDVPSETKPSSTVLHPKAVDRSNTRYNMHIDHRLGGRPDVTNFT